MTSDLISALGFFQSSGTLVKNHPIAKDLTFWKRYELSVDLNIQENTYSDWSNVLWFSVPKPSRGTTDPGDRLPAIQQLPKSNTLEFTSYINGVANYDYDHVAEANQWFNVKFVQVHLTVPVWNFQNLVS